MAGQLSIPLNVTKVKADLIVRVRYFLWHIRQTSAHPIVDVGQRDGTADGQLAVANTELRVPFERQAPGVAAEANDAKRLQDCATGRRLDLWHHVKTDNIARLPFRASELHLEARGVHLAPERGYEVVSLASYVIFLPRVKY